MNAPSSSPPPYSLNPPEVHPPPPSARPAKRVASSPQIHPPGPAYGDGDGGAGRARPPPPPHTRSQSSTHTVHATSDEDESGAETDEGVVFRAAATGLSLADTLRHRLLGKGKARAHDERWARPITTAPGALCAGETETEGEDSPRNLPTARITHSSLSHELALPASTAWLVPILFQLFRLLAVVPACVGTLWNLYFVFRPPDGRVEMRVDHAVAVLWSILTGWQCLQITSGLLKRWRVYYSPFATLVRLLGLQAICWPATHLTLTVLDHELRPLICWAAIGTTTCCSRAVQLWVTSNIVPIPSYPPPPASAAATHPPASAEEELMRRGKRRVWDWAQVLTRCALPAGVVYFAMAWALAVRADVLGC
ncbi:N-glycosylation protein-domain-containing protein [Epithele typhae]|uniref:N-glycosylation protein-domain-containing protein n=1 Tax=Epithele typhae TaxID=378194 RepID=UPI002008D7C5|nr:N-glycosylation protein-domain-containing protein [Epithele typhae]KAH9933973.1 N-glycosylation protein-domain-containing protein [Epithele typhae]